MTALTDKLRRRQQQAGREQRAYHLWARRLLERVFAVLHSARMIEQEWQDNKQKKNGLAYNHFKLRCFNGLKKAISKSTRLTLKKQQLDSKMR